VTATAFTHADVLRRIAGDDPIESHTALATEFGRDPSNLRKTMKALESEGLILRPEAERPTLTDLGRQVLHGIDVAEGVAADNGDAATALRWPVDKIRANPANRSINPADIDDLADSIVSLGDIIQPLTLSPPDANGVRMILAGERRWRAVMAIMDRDAEAHNEEVLNGGLVMVVPSLPEALEAGVPFVEREADEATAILITIVENSQREDLSPWEDAQQLLKLAEATGWSGAEIARRTGRASETKKNGAKDVQDKLKIAREATPDAISDYLRSGSWDDLRNSVRDRKPVDNDPDQLPMFDAWADPEAARTAPLCTYVPGQPYRARFDRRAPERCIGDVAPDLIEVGGFLAIGDAAEAGTIETLALPWSRPGKYYPHSYPQAQIQIAKLAGIDAWVSASGYSLSDIGDHVGLSGISRPTSAYPDRRTALIAGIDSIAEGITRNKNGRIPPAIAEWLQDPTPVGPHVVNHIDYLNASRAAEARRATGIDPTHAPNGGGLKKVLEDLASPDRPIELSDLARLALIELTIKIKLAPKPTGGEHDPERPLSSSDLPGAWARYGAPIGAYWTDPTFAELTKAGLIRVVHQKHGQPTLATLTDKGVAFLGDYLPPNMLSQGVALQPVTGSLLPPEGQAYFTAWLETESRPASAPDAAPLDEQDADDRDDFGRDAGAVAADIVLLGEVQDFYHNDDEEPDEAAAMALMRRLGVTGPFEEDGDGGLTALVNGKVEALAFIDIDRTMPDDRSRAIGMLVAWACRVVFGGEVTA
jgi:hypothetical protein